MLGGRQKREASEQRNMGWGGWATLETPRVCAGRGVDQGEGTLDCYQKSLGPGPSPSADLHCCVTQESHCPV